MVVVADVDYYDQPWYSADEPRVGPFVRRSRLAEGLISADLGARAGAPARHLLQHRAHRDGDRGRHGGRELRAVLLERLIALREYFFYRVGLRLIAVVGERRICDAHFERRQARRAERDGEVVRQVRRRYADAPREVGYVAHAAYLREAHGGGVYRTGERAHQRYLAVVLVGGVVARGPAVGEFQRRVEHVVHTAVALLERGGVDYRLEGRAGLAEGLRRAVELALVEVASADEREYLARVRVYRDERAFVLHRGDELLGLGLEVFVYRRVYAEAAAVNPVCAIGGQQVAEKYVGDEIGRVLERYRVAAPRALRELRRFVYVLVVVGLGYPVKVEHPAQDVRLARLRVARMSEGRVFFRRGYEAGEHRGFVDVELRGRFAEIFARRRLYAVGAVAHVYRVEVHLEQLVLGVDALEPYREDDFARLADYRLFVGEEEVARELLRYRACALLRLAVEYVHHEGSRYGNGADAAVLVEFVVLGGEDGLHHPRRNVLELHPRAVFLEELRYQPALAVVDLRREARLVREYLGRRRQRLGDFLEEEQRRDGYHSRGDGRREHERGEKFGSE